METTRWERMFQKLKAEVIVAEATIMGEVGAGIMAELLTLD